MLAEVIRERLMEPEFHPFALVLVNGERIHIPYRDSIGLISTIVNNRRMYSPYVTFVLSEGDSIITRSISLPMIAQVIDENRLSGAA